MCSKASILFPRLMKKSLHRMHLCDLFTIVATATYAHICISWREQKTSFRLFTMTTMFPTKLSAHETCDVLINAIKSSNLHFVFQETPHSAYITIRKKFVNKAFSKASGNDIDTRAALKNLEIEYNKLKKDFEEKTASHEESLYLVKTLENKLDKVEENFIIDSEKLKTNNEEFTKKKNKLRLKLCQAQV